MQWTIAEWRRLKKISQAELAKRCGVSVMTIRNWEDNPGSIRTAFIPKIAVALEVSSNDIIFLPNDTTKGSMGEV